MTTPNIRLIVAHAAWRVALQTVQRAQAEHWKPLPCRRAMLRLRTAEREYVAGFRRSGLPARAAKKSAA